MGPRLRLHPGRHRSSEVRFFLRVDFYRPDYFIETHRGQVTSLPQPLLAHLHPHHAPHCLQRDGVVAEFPCVERNALRIGNGAANRLHGEPDALRPRDGRSRLPTGSAHGTRQKRRLTGAPQGTLGRHRAALTRRFLCPHINFRRGGHGEKRIGARHRDG